MAQWTTAPWRPATTTGALEGAAAIAPAVGRLLLSAIFLVSGVMKFLNWGSTAEHMADKGIPLAEIALPVAALVEIAGGLMVLFGWQARLGALALALFLVPTTLLFHNFWAFEGMQYTNQMHHFMKNLAIMGGLLVLVGLGAGPWSCDNALSRSDASPR